MLTRRTFLAASLAAAGAGAGSGLYTWLVEPHWVEFVRRPLPVRGLPASLVGARLVQLTDIHVGRQVADDYVTGIFRRVAVLQPELVVFTGDYTTYHPGVFGQAERVYAELPRGRLATLGILGNHDYGPGWRHPEMADRISRILSDAGLRILRNEIAEVGGLQVVGLDDLWAYRFHPGDALARLDRGRPALALSHNPDTADLSGWEDFEGWILSGHTHGGQCKPPFLPPPMLPVRNRRYTAGEFALAGERRLYIGRGVGHLLRVRFNVRPEVTVFTLEAS